MRKATILISAVLLSVPLLADVQAPVFTGGGDVLGDGTVVTIGDLVIDLSYEQGSIPAWFATCPGDVDGDLQVGLSDLAVILADFGEIGADLPGDVDGDGDVDLTDLAELLNAFGADCR